MKTLNTGKRAPEVSLPLLEGGTFSLRDALQRGPVALAFFKVSCPVCQFTFPYLERVYQSHRKSKVTIIGVSQDDAKATRAFVREYGMTFPVAMDETRSYPVSNAYGLTTVPTVFLVAPDGEIELAMVGWSRADIEELNRRLAEAARAQSTPVFQRGEDVPAFRGG